MLLGWLLGSSGDHDLITLDFLRRHSSIESNTLAHSHTPNQTTKETHTTNHSVTKIYIYIQ